MLSVRYLLSELLNEWKPVVIPVEEDRKVIGILRKRDLPAEVRVAPQDYYVTDTLVWVRRNVVADMLKTYLHGDTPWTITELEKRKGYELKFTNEEFAELYGREIRYYRVSNR